MGEAKRRGTFEERRAVAVAKKEAEEKIRAAIEEAKYKLIMDKLKEEFREKVLAKYKEEGRAEYTEEEVEADIQSLIEERINYIGRETFKQRMNSIVFQAMMQSLAADSFSKWNK